MVFKLIYSFVNQSETHRNGEEERELFHPLLHYPSGRYPLYQLEGCTSCPLASHLGGMGQVTSLYLAGASA